MIRSDYSPTELPGSLRLPSQFPFVGRSAELTTLRALMPRAAGEGRRVVLIGGEPGSGKSRLARELATAEAGDGTLVLYGACDAVVRTPYGPFVEVLDHLVRSVDPGDLRAALGATGGELTRLLPDLAARVGGLAPPVAADPDTERHRLHTAVGDLLTVIGRQRPLLLVVEDAHWADVPTLLLLRYLARAAGGARLMLVATFRDGEADVGTELAEALADLRRTDGVIRMRLDGLSADEVVEFVQRAGGDDAAPVPYELCRVIGELTGGNAFLVCELWRELVETGVVAIDDGVVRLTGSPTDLGTPESVREVVSQRLARLDPGTTDVLELAATAGGEFALDLMRRAAGVPDAELLVRLDEAVASGIVEEVPGLALGYRFTHELVRRALYDRLTAARRAELHLRVGEALEGVEGRAGRALADLAHHFAAAAPLGGAERGVDYNVLAARAAAATLAFDEAATRLRVALELGIAEPARRAGVMLELGTSSRRAGRSVDALGAFRAAAATARELGDAELLARAAIGYEDACWRPGIPDQVAVELLDEASAAVGEEDSELRVRLLGGHARGLDFRGLHARADAVRSEALAMARRLDDLPSLAAILVGSYWSRRLKTHAEVLAMLDEAVAIGTAIGDIEITSEAMGWRVPTLIALADLDAARREETALEKIAEQTAQPFVMHVSAHYRSALALCDGDLKTAEATAHRSHEWGRLLTGRDPSAVYGIQMFGIRREQGRLMELAPVVRLMAARPGPWRPGLVAVLAELGLESEARAELAKIAAEGIDRFRDALWLASLVYLADASAAIGDQTMAALVYDALEPYRGDIVMIGHLVSCYGAADRYLGMLAATRCDWRRADEHFEAATELNRRTGMTTWLGHTLYQHARALQRRGDRDGAAARLGEAARLAERYGLTALLARVHALGEDVPAEQPPDGLSSREVQILALVAGGLSNREIGERLVISEHTAANHIRSILRKTGCANRTQATTYAHRHGLVEA